jgi:hypothetical protein
VRAPESASELASWLAPVSESASASRLALVSVGVLVLASWLAPVSESASGLGWEPLG